MHVKNCLKARSIFESLMMTHGWILNDESFHTLLTGVVAVVYFNSNSLPLTVETVSKAVSLIPYNHQPRKSKEIMPPPGVFQKDDMYINRH